MYLYLEKVKLECYFLLYIKNKLKWWNIVMNFWNFESICENVWKYFKILKEMGNI